MARSFGPERSGRCSLDRLEHEGFVTRAWRIRAPGEHDATFASTWARQVAAVACWPGAPVALERRFVKPPGSNRMREYVVATTEGAGFLAGRESLVQELDRLVLPLRGLQLMEPVDADDLSDLLTPEGICDVAELPELSDIAPEGALTLGGHLGEMVDRLAASEGGTILSLSVATPRELGAVPETPWAASESVGSVATHAELPALHRRPVRFALRLASTEMLSPSALAVAGALALSPGSSAGEEWLRAAGPKELTAARGTLARPSTDPWWGDGFEEERCSSTIAAAVVLSLPADSAALDRLPVAMTPMDGTRHAGAPIGKVPDRSGELSTTGLDWKNRTGGIYVAGATGTGKSTLAGHILHHDIHEAGRTTVVLDPHGPLADQALALVPDGRRDQTVVLDPLDPRSPAFDLLPGPGGEDPHRIASRITDAMQELYDPAVRHR